METSKQIIEEIKDDAVSLQRKLLTLPAPGETISEKQEKAIEKAQNGLRNWRGWDLGELVNTFSG